MSNHFHVVLRSRPDVVATFSDREVARRWLLICPFRKAADDTPAEPSAAELNSIRSDATRLAEIRSRLSDISWWMRLVCQRIGTRANAEDGERGKFWQSRFRAVRILDEASLLACAAYVDLNPILERLSSTPDTWTAIVGRFGQLFIHVAGRPSTIDDYRSPDGARRFNVRGEARQLLSSAA